MSRQRVRIHEVAAEAGVSVGLVSLALNGRPGVADATRMHINQVADRMGYRVHPAARTLRTGSSGMFGMIVRNFGNPLFTSLIAGVQRRATEVGVTVLAIDSDYSGTVEEKHIRQLASQEVDALAIAPVGAGDSIELWQRLCPGLPTVVINAPRAALDDVIHVGPDNAAAVELAVAHLVEQGHERVALITAPMDLMADHDRLAVFEGLAASQRLDPIVLETQLNLPAVEQAVMDTLRSSRPPSAIITNSDYTAQAVYRAARRCGVRIGEELAVIGHDDLPLSDLLDPPLTTIQVDLERVGAAIFDRLTGAVGDDYRAPVKLIKRASA